MVLATRTFSFANQPVSFPVYFSLGPLRLHPHFVMELAAYAIGLYGALFRRLRKSVSLDPNVLSANLPPVSPSQRTSVSVGALFGALTGAKLLVALQHLNLLASDWRLFLLVLLQGKTIVGALLGGLIGVELTKKHIGVRRSTGDGFVYPVLWGMAIGRVGCFLTGLSDRTYGTATSLPWGVDFGDGIARHPTQLYEAGFLLLLFVLLRLYERTQRREGDLFKFYTIAYLSFRLLVDSIKPEFRPLLGLSAIQMACVCGLVYYARDAVRIGRAVVSRMQR